MTSWASEPEDGPWAARSARISLRLQPAALEALRAAAELRAQDLTSFVLGAALDRAADVMGRERNSRLQLALIAEDPARYRRDARIPDDPDLVAMVAEALLARDRRRPGDVPTVDLTPVESRRHERSATSAPPPGEGRSGGSGVGVGARGEVGREELGQVDALDTG